MNIHPNIFINAKIIYEHTNMDRLFNDLDHDFTFLKEVVNDFIESFPSQIDTLYNAIKISDYDSIKYILHTLKGAASNFDAFLIIKHAILMENLTESNRDITLCEQNFNYLNIELATFKYIFSDPNWILFLGSEV